MGGRSPFEVWGEEGASLIIRYFTGDSLPKVNKKLQRVVLW